MNRILMFRRIRVGVHLVLDYVKAIILRIQYDLSLIQPHKLKDLLNILHNILLNS